MLYVTEFAGSNAITNRPDVGTARVDFPGGDAKDLYTSIERLFKLSGDFRIFSGKFTSSTSLSYLTFYPFNQDTTTPLLATSRAIAQ